MRSAVRRTGAATASRARRATRRPAPERRRATFVAARPAAVGRRRVGGRGRRRGRRRSLRRRGLRRGIGCRRIGLRRVGRRWVVDPAVGLRRDRRAGRRRAGAGRRRRGWRYGSARRGRCRRPRRLGGRGPGGLRGGGSVGGTGREPGGRLRARRGVARKQAAGHRPRQGGQSVAHVERHERQEQAERHQQERLPEPVEVPGAEVQAVVEDAVRIGGLRVAVVDRRRDQSQRRRGQGDRDHERAQAERELDEQEGEVLPGGARAEVGLDARPGALGAAPRLRRGAQARAQQRVGERALEGGEGPPARGREPEHEDPYPDDEQ